ncbi:phage tail tape measure protein [Bacillus thuringiensis]|uniref:phage tail tape measure protein n=1 Tax=Bacillus thuringiensis TaxID=1428 RepID=UPI003BF698FA
MTMYEDQGQNIINTLLGAKDKTVDFGKQQDKLNDSIKKMDANPAVKFQKAMQDLQMALKPVLGVIADVVAKIADWISNNPKLAATLAAIAVAIGVISGAFMALAPIVVVISSIGLAMTGWIALFGVIVAAVVALGITIYKNWDSISQWTIDTFNSIGKYLSELWSGIVETASSWLSSLVESVSGWWASLVESTTMWLSSLVETASSYWSSLVETASTWLSSLVETASGWFSSLIDTAVGWLSSLVETASTWWSSLVETATQFFIQLYQKWQEIWNSILTFLDPIISLISTVLQAGWLLIQAGAQIAWAAISQYIIQPIQQAYEWVSTKIGELVTWLGTQWEIAKAVAQVAWGLFKQYIIQPVQETWTLVKQKFTDLYNSAREKFDSVKNAAQEKFEAAKRFIIDPIKDAVDKVERFVDKIKSFFSNLRLKIPSPEMPKLPHFSLQTSTWTVMGKNITIPSGVNVDWRAKGGIFTKPTIFGMNGGNLQGAGEAGDEAVLPLNKKTLGGIGAGIVAAMPRGQFAMSGEINQLMSDMGRMMTSSASQLAGLKNVMSGVYGNMSNSRQAMTNSVSNQVVNNSFGSSSNGVTPMLGGDLVVEVPVVLDGRDVARGTYRYTTEYQEREEKRNSDF